VRTDYSRIFSSTSHLNDKTAGQPHIFAFAPNAWDGPWMNRQQILSRLARRGWQVTYSTGPLSSWHRGTDTWREAPWFSGYESRDGVQVEIPGKSLPRWPRARLYDRFVRQHHAAVLLRKAQCTPASALSYVFHPSLGDVASSLNSRWLVYHAYDSFALQPSWTDNLARAEEKLLRRADLVIASSAAVADALHRAGRDEVMVLPNGGDAQAFEAGTRLPCPADLMAIPRPRIAYIGHINRKVDFPMIAAVARRRPDWHWVLVGPIASAASAAPSNDPKIAAAFRDCQTLPNVHFLGGKPHVELPAYAAHMDVNTMCYRTDRGWWNAGSPLKLHEYLATGRPVVSVELRDIRAFGEVIAFVRNMDEWRRAIEGALLERSSQMAERRRRIARANSWDNRVDLLEHQLRVTIDGDPAHAAVAPEAEHSLVG
jgi:glycosyltransferase involved in cell wall biosynthesis